MGLIVDTKYGIPVVHHGGALIGYHSDMIWLPQHDVGAVILTNADPGWALREPFRRKEVASRHNPDGTVSFVTVSPGVIGNEFVVGSGPRPTLIVRDAQHEYVFTAASTNPSAQ